MPGRWKGKPDGKGGTTAYWDATDSGPDQITAPTQTMPGAPSNQGPIGPYVPDDMARKTRPPGPGGPNRIDLSLPPPPDEWPQAWKDLYYMTGGTGGINPPWLGADPSGSGPPISKMPVPMPDVPNTDPRFPGRNGPGMPPRERGSGPIIPTDPVVLTPGNGGWGMGGPDPMNPDDLMASFRDHWNPSAPQMPAGTEPGLVSSAGSGLVNQPVDQMQDLRRLRSVPIGSLGS